MTSRIVRLPTSANRTLPVPQAVEVVAGIEPAAARKVAEIMNGAEGPYWEYVVVDSGAETPLRRASSVHPMAYVDPAATIAEGCTIGAFAWIGPRVIMGARCEVGPGAKIGQDGFGYKRVAGRWVKKPHRKGVFIGAEVHIGANACIDRGSWRDTWIGGGARIDNLVHVAHNALIGEDAVLVAQAEVSGSVIVGRGAWIGPRACVRQRLTIGAGALVGMGAVVTADVEPNVTVAGCPARVIDRTRGVHDEM